RWVHESKNQLGYFCVFTDEFLEKNKSGVALDRLPIFKSGGYPVFEISNEQADELAIIFKKMDTEIASEYEYKYDLLRNYVQELIHYGQKLQPATTIHAKHDAAARITSLFIELLERQFPIESPGQKLKLRSAHEYAQRLAIHANHLNKVRSEERRVGKDWTDTRSKRDWSSDVCSSDLTDTLWPKAAAGYDYPCQTRCGGAHNIVIY